MTVDVRRLAGLSGSFFGTGLCLAFGVYNGVQQLTVITTLPWIVIEIVTVSAVPAVLVFTALATLSGLMLTREVFSSPDPDEQLVEGPPITAIVPVYGDGDVLRTSVKSLLESNYSDVSVAI